MGMNACGGCRRHVRGDTCPFCGAAAAPPEERIAPTPHRLAWGARVATAAAAAAGGAFAAYASGCAVYGAPEGPVRPQDASGTLFDDAALEIEDAGVRDADAASNRVLCPLLPTDAGIPDASASSDAGDAGSACLDPALAGTLPTRGEPTIHPGLCTDLQRSGLFQACLATGATQTTCNVFLKTAGNEACVECILGPTASTVNPARLAPPALISAGGSVLLDIGACAAAVTGNRCCGPRMADEAYCRAAACGTCEAADRAACLDAARAPCGDAVRAAAPCTTGLEIARATWASACGVGGTFESSYASLTKTLCGMP